MSEDFTAAFSGTDAVREGHGFDEAKLAEWMAANVEGYAGPLTVRQFKGGQSNPTYQLITPSRKYVLRRKPPGELLPGAHAVDREATVLTRLGAVGFPVARVYGLCTDDAVIGYIGSFYDYEGIDDLIAAMPALVARQPGARLLLVGGGPMEAALKAQAAASQAAAHIHFVGRVPHQEVERYYSLIDILAYPRKKMRLTDLVTPLKPLEAMAQGKLVAASDVGGHRELIEDGETGTLFAPDDPAAVADALAGLLENQAMWPERRRTARIFVETHRNWSSNILRYGPVYQRLLRGG